jgi:hypothetical protein
MKEAGIGNQSELARRIIERTPGLFAKSPENERYRRLGQQLSRLKQGTVSWWRGQPQALQALAEILSIPEQHILEGRIPGGLIEFIEFPALRPLAPTTESPPEGTGWTKFPGKADGSAGSKFDFFTSTWWDGCIWLQVPPGAGKSLATQIRQARSAPRTTAARAEKAGQLAAALVGGRSYKTHILVADRLAALELSGISVESRLFIELESTDPRTDQETLRALTQYESVVVLASFPRPGGGPSSGRDRLFFESSEPTGPWTDLEWGPRPGWRHAFIQWMAERLGEERKGFEPEEFHSWLERLDPDGVLVRTPGELLTLGNLAHEMGVRRLNRQFAEGWKDIARTVTPRMLHREARDDSSRAFWLRAAGSEAIRTLTLAAFRDSSSAWPPSASLEVWAARLPSSHAAPASEKLLDEKLQALCRAKSGRERQRHAQEVKAATRSLSPAMAIDYLRSTRLMRVQPDGGLGPHPRWMVDALARESVEEALSRTPETWGRWAADPGRQSIVDRALDTLPLQRLLALAEQVVRAFDDTHLGLVGAVEALFSACARKLEDTPAPPQQELLRKLAHCQLSVLTQRYDNGLLSPVTRPGHRENSSSSWLADCWTWSFTVDAPNWPLPSALRWFFPGWVSLSLADEAAHEVLNYIDRVGDGTHRSHERIVARLPAILDRCCGVPPPHEIPEPLMPAFMVWAARRGIAPPLKQVAHLTLSASLLDELLWRLDREGQEVQATVAATLFRALAKTAGGVAHLFNPRAAFPLRPPLDSWLLARLDEAAIRGAVEEGGPGDLHSPALVPPRVLYHVVRRWLEHQHPRLDASLRGLGPEYLPVLELFIERDHWKPGVCEELWRLAPERALQRALRGLEQEAPSRESLILTGELFYTSPPDNHPLLFDALEARPAGSLPDWAARWLARQVHTSGALAERAYVLQLKVRKSRVR